MSTITINEIREKLEFIRRMYDAVRIVDPIRKTVLAMSVSELAETPEICYMYWHSGRICDNCISIRAYRENKSFLKLERSPEAVMVVTATPIENSERPLVLELFKNASDTLFIGTGEYSQGQPFTRFTEEITEMIVKDPSTGLYNRRFVEERLPVDLVRSVLKGQPLSICFFDLDCLKAINDTCGHDAGDEAIRKSSEVFLKNIRTDFDWAARYGGDEFLICLQNTDAEGAELVAKRIQKSIENTKLMCTGVHHPLSVSYGIKTMTDVPMTAEEIIHIADQNMYEAKKRKEAERQM